MDIRKDDAAQRGAFQVRAFLVDANLAESEVVLTFKLASFLIYLLVKDVFCHCSINSI